jgi:hypothetical protein
MPGTVSFSVPMMCACAAEVKMRSFLFLLILVFILAGCSPPTEIASPGVIPVPTATWGAPAPSETGVQPISAEETLFVFLMAYEGNMDEMVPFLSPALRENLPPGGVPELLGFDGTLEGLVFTSGSTAMNPNLAIIETRLQVNGAEIGRTFYLERQENDWLITAIERSEE